MSTTKPTGPSQPTAILTNNASPLPLTREEKLKIFALLSIRRDLPKDILTDHKLSLALSAAYSPGDAILAAKQAILQIGLKPDDYRIPVMMINVDADKIIQQEPQTKIIPSPLTATEAQTKEKDKKKSTDDIVSYVSYMFDKVGTDEEKKTAQKVIKKFKAHAVKNKQN